MLNQSYLRSRFAALAARSSREYRGAVRLDGYRFGRVLVDGEEHTKDVIVLPNRVVGDWWRRDGHSLVLEDLEDVLDELPERLILGTGAYGRMGRIRARSSSCANARSRSRACPRPTRSSASGNWIRPGPRPPCT